MGLASSPTYEVALWEVCRKVMETAASLQNDLDRLDNEMTVNHRAQAGSLHWEHSRGGSGDRAGAWSQDYHQVGSQDKWAHL